MGYKALWLNLILTEGRLDLESHMYNMTKVHLELPTPK